MASMQEARKTGTLSDFQIINTKTLYVFRHLFIAICVLIDLLLAIKYIARSIKTTTDWSLW